MLKPNVQTEAPEAFVRQFEPVPECDDPVFGAKRAVVREYLRTAGPESVRRMMLSQWCEAQHYTTLSVMPWRG